MDSDAKIMTHSNLPVAVAPCSYNQILNNIAQNSTEIAETSVDKASRTLISMCRSDDEKNESYPIRWKVFKYGVISGPSFPVSGLNTGKYGLEITPYLDTFHAVPKNCKSVVKNAISVAVRIDDTWQNQYGFISFLGVVFMISVYTGVVTVATVKLMLRSLMSKNL